MSQTICWSLVGQYQVCFNWFDGWNRVVCGGARQFVGECLVGRPIGMRISVTWLILRWFVGHDLLVCGGTRQFVGECWTGQPIGTPISVTWLTRGTWVMTKICRVVCAGLARPTNRRRHLSATKVLQKPGCAVYFSRRICREVNVLRRTRRARSAQVQLRSRATKCVAAGGGHFEWMKEYIL